MAFIELIQQYPRVSIIIFAFLITLFISIINYFFMNKEKMKEIKAKQKRVQEEIKKHQREGNHAKAMELQKELLADMPELFKHSLKPMIITIIPILIFFSFLKGAYAETIIAKTWFWYYLVSALVGSLIFRKLLKLP